MLLCQNLRGRHQRSLVAVLNGQPRSRSRNHCLTAAHIALHQPVHGCAFFQIFPNLQNRSVLRPGQSKGQKLIKAGQIRIGIGRNFFLRPGCAYQSKTGRENKKLLKNQPFSSLLRLLHRSRLMNGRISLLGWQNMICFQYLRRQNLLRRIANHQRLLNSL